MMSIDKRKPYPENIAEEDRFLNSPENIKRRRKSSGLKTLNFKNLYIIVSLAQD